MRIAHHPGNSGKSGNLLWSALCVAAGDHDFGIGIFTMNAANGGTGILVRRGGHSAGIEHNNPGFFSTTCRCKTLCRKLAFQSGPVSLCGAASKVLNKKSWHNK